MFFQSFYKKILRETLTAFSALLICLMLFGPATAVLAQEASPQNSEIVVSTGDALSVSVVENEVNTNTVETEVLSDDFQAIVPTSDVVNSSEESEEGELATTTSESIETQNTAQVSNGVISEAATGGNAAGGSSGIFVTSGEAVALAEVVNVVNTNIIDSSSFIGILNNVLGEVPRLDTRELIGQTVGENAGCGEDSPCGGDSARLAGISNVAVVNNAVVARAMTGDNAATGDGGGISTGDAYASGNIVNVVNTNIVGSNVFMMIFNNFGDWDGDIVFPSASHFANQVFAGSADQTSGGNGQSVVYDANNDAVVSNNTSAVSQTGGNGISGQGGIIESGSALSVNSAVNDVNGNYFNTDRFYVLLRVFGNWSGDIYGLPAGMSVAGVPFGAEIVGTGMIGEEELPVESVSAGNENVSILAVSSDNIGLVSNNLSVSAVTGGNRAVSEDSTIATGDAFAASSVVNVVNTNILGRNWITAVINVFGSWSGNVSFGEPDLWVGTVVKSPKEIEAGSSADFTFTVANRGDADATDVTLENDFDGADFLAFGGFRSGRTRADSPVTRWNLGTIRAGEARTFTARAVVGREAPQGVTEVFARTVVSAAEPEYRKQDNADEVAFLVVNNFVQRVDGAFVEYTPDPILKVEKFSNAPFGVVASSTVEYTIKITNEGGPAYHAVLLDELRDEDGVKINENGWDLGEIYPDEEITVTYSMFYGADTPEGVYVNTARVESVGRHPSLNPFYGHFVNSNDAVSRVFVAASEGEARGGVSDEVFVTLLSATSTLSTGALPILTPAPASLSDKLRQEIEEGAYSQEVFYFPAGMDADEGDGGNSFDRFALIASVGKFPLPKKLDLFVLVVSLVGISLNRFYKIGAVKNTFNSFLL